MLEGGQELPWLSSSQLVGTQESCLSPKLTRPIYKYYATYNISLCSCEFEVIFALFKIIVRVCSCKLNFQFYSP